MFWYPAIIVLWLGNAALLAAIAFVTVLRRRRPAPDQDIEALSALVVREAMVRFAAANDVVPSRTVHDAADPAVIETAMDPGAAERAAAIRLLGTHSDSESRSALAELLRDRDPAIAREAAAAAAASARAGYPRPLDAGVVDELLRVLDEELVRAVVVEAIDALAYSLDPRVPAALLRRIPSSRGSLRERLIESGALFAHLVQSVEQRQPAVGV
jgi:hypothetical protein